jgi:hypothetical protein
MAHEALVAPRPLWFGSLRKMRTLLYSDMTEIPDKEAVNEIVGIATNAFSPSWRAFLFSWVLPRRDGPRRAELARELIRLEARVIASAHKQVDTILRS